MLIQCGTLRARFEGGEQTALKSEGYGDADDRVWCVAARDACLAASLNLRRPAPHLLLAGIDRKTSYEHVFELYLEQARIIYCLRVCDNSSIRHIETRILQDAIPASQWQVWLTSCSITMVLAR